MSKQHDSQKHIVGSDVSRHGQQAPNPMKSDVGRTDDVPRETAAGAKSGASDGAHAPKVAMKV